MKNGFAKVWTADDPFNTPRGLADPDRAVASFNWAVTETARRYGSFDVAWGDVHRVRRGIVDVPVGGCASSLGCFRALAFSREPDGKLAANGGDGWILAVEFDDVPQALSILAYGESPRRDSPWFADQAEMFAKGQLKPVAFTPKTSTLRRSFGIDPASDTLWLISRQATLFSKHHS
jgi:acyl-homoserine-lactone acylase